ncbi:MAG: hypothetical protein M0P50_03350, partial [Bacteroidales bacterium]|nr:hypothetical protein [Bacteroidales bacterium]
STRLLAERNLKNATTTLRLVMSSEIPNPKFQISTSTHQHISTSAHQNKLSNEQQPALSLPKGTTNNQALLHHYLPDGNTLS